jgi:hypothetical protein
MTAGFEPDESIPNANLASANVEYEAFKRRSLVLGQLNRHCLRDNQLSPSDVVGK